MGNPLCYLEIIQINCKIVRYKITFLPKSFWLERITIKEAAKVEKHTHES